MESLAQLLADRLQTALPFLDRVVGLARLNTKTIADGEATRPIKLPVPVTFTAAECESDDRYLVPDKSTVGIFFFEDGGTVPLITTQLPASLGVKQTSLRLLGWVNNERLAWTPTEAQLLAFIEKALKVNRHYTEGDFVDILTTYTLLPAETSLFSRYTYATETPLLLPPYRIIGLELKIQFRLATKCLTSPLPLVVDAPVC